MEAAPAEASRCVVQARDIKHAEDGRVIGWTRTCTGPPPGFVANVDQRQPLRGSEYK